MFVAAAGPYALVEPQLDEAGTGDWQPQHASGCAVRATPIPDALVEVHSHHAMRAYFSATDYGLYFHIAADVVGLTA